MHPGKGEGLGAVNARPFLFFLVFTQLPRRVIFSETGLPALTV
jgi:hypothetical protein